MSHNLKVFVVGNGMIISCKPQCSCSLQLLWAYIIVGFASSNLHSIMFVRVRFLGSCK